jgi:hypothetical protein
MFARAIDCGLANLVFPIAKGHPATLLQARNREQCLGKINFESDNLQVFPFGFADDCVPILALLRHANSAPQAREREVPFIRRVLHGFPR